MTFAKIGSNQRERYVQVKRPGDDKPHHITMLYSYDTLVAAYDRAEDKLYITQTYHSVTTNRHLNKWTQSTRFSDTPRFVMTQDALWELHHKANLFEAEEAGVTA